MIKIQKDRRIVRETIGKGFEYTDENGDRQVAEEIRILYYSPTTATVKQRMADMKALEESKEPFYWFSKKLLGTLHSLPDLADENGKPIEITEEFLDGESAANLKMINDAIEADIAPKSEGTK